VASCGRPGSVVVGHGLAVAGRRLLLLRQHCQFGVALVLGPEGLAGACCSTEVVLRASSGGVVCG
jgi:hypothetical protein